MRKHIGRVSKLIIVKLGKILCLDGIALMHAGALICTDVSRFAKRFIRVNTSWLFFFIQRSRLAAIFILLAAF